MFIKKKLYILGLVCALFIINEGFSQSSSSTYSSFGLGDFNNSGMTHNQAMGGLGVSYGTGFNVNVVNPALSVNNSAFNFQAAFNYSRISATSEVQKQHFDGGGFNYVAMSLPVAPGKWSIGLGLNQISSVNYNLSATSPVDNSDLLSVNNIQGDGGITEAYLQTGFKLLKNLNLGLHGSYIFGSTIRTNLLTLSDAESRPVGISTEYYERLSLSDVAVKGGLHYLQKIGNQKYLNFGAIYHIFGNINGTEYAKVADEGQASDPNSEGDILSDNVKGSIVVPNKLGYGITYEKINKLAIGLEFQHQDFRDYRDFRGQPDELQNSYKVGLGAQFVPNIYSMDSFLDRITYRAGLEYEQTPYIVSGKSIRDIGINFGGSIPMNNLSLMNIAFKYGTRGSVANGLVRENYFKISLGISINDNSWFYKRVFE
ncbi:MAG TPA: hypothetical protein VK014_07690 [Cyclobacteriaceae bacterium]|nr:hypothetical protein [Cyclobacteriaceae bacterium]